MSIIFALLVLSFLIFFHELGHFLAARLFGVQVDVFSIGFGKRLFTKRIGSTEWSISAIPLGGYVKMKGQDDIDPLAKSSDNDSYSTKKPWQRIIILLAGPFANFVVAFMLYVGVAQIGTYPSPLFNYSAYLPATIGDFSKNSPAQQAGMQKGDTILFINRQKVDNWGEVGEIIQRQYGTIIFTVMRDNQQQNIQVNPIIETQKNRFGEDIKRKIIGILPHVSNEPLSFNFLQSIKFAWSETLYASTLIFQSLQKLLTGAVPASQLGGVVTIVDTTAKATKTGLIALFLFTALISVNLGVLNLLPIPALDGGHIVFNLYETIRRKAPSEEVMYRLTFAGWLILLSLMTLGLYNDINRLFLG